MHGEDARGAGAERALGEDEFGLLQRQRLGPHEPAVAGREARHDDDDDRLDARSDQGDEGEGEHDRRKRANRVEDEDDGIVEPARTVTGDEPEDPTDDHGKRHRDERHFEGDPRADDDAREDVAAELVGAEEMSERGFRQFLRNCNTRRIVRRDPIGEHGREDDGDDKGQAETAERVSEKPAPRRTARRLYWDMIKDWRGHAGRARRR